MKATQRQTLSPAIKATGTLALIAAFATGIYLAARRRTEDEVIDEPEASPELINAYRRKLG